MKMLGIFLALFVCGGCARFFACETDLTYIVRPDNSREINYSSCKEQIGLDADYDPKTGKFHVKVDKASTQEAAIAAALQLQIRLTEMMQQMLDKLAALGALGGS